MRNWITWVEKPAVWRLATVLYVLVMAGLFCAYVVVSLWDVETFVYIQGPQHLRQDRPNAVRGVIMNAQTGRVRKAVDRVDIGFQRVRKGSTLEATTTLLAPKTLTLGQGGYIHNVLHLEEMPQGEAWFAMKIAVDEGAQPFVSRSRVHVMGAEQALEPVAETSRRNDNEQTSSRHGVYDAKGVITLEVIPKKPELARGLPARFYLAAHAQDGTPATCTIKMTQKYGYMGKAILKTVRTSTLGLAQVNLTAGLSQGWDLSATCDGADAPSTAKLHIETVAAQLSLSPMHPLVSAGSKIQMRADSLHQRGALYADLYQQNHWTQAQTFGLRRGKGGVVFNAPKVDAPEILRVQAYQDLYMQDNAWDAREVVVGPKTLSTQDALRYVLTTLPASAQSGFWGGIRAALNSPNTNASSSAYLDALEAALMARPHGFEEPGVLINSRSGDKDAMEARKRAIKADLLIVIIFAMVIGVLALLMATAISIIGYQERQRETDSLMLEEHDNPDVDDASRRRQRRGRIALVAQGTIVVGTIMVFCALIIMLLSYL